MSNVVSIINGQPIIQGGCITSASKPEKTAALPTNLFQVGDTFSSGDGVRVHVMDSRWNEYGGLEYLYCAHGVRTWAAASKFKRMA